MATTDGLKLPIPELTDTADGPDAFSDLGNAVEDYLLDRILPSGITHYPSHHWGSGTAFPTAAQGAKASDTYLHTGLGGSVMMLVSGTSWRQVAVGEVANYAALDAMANNYSSLLHPGLRVRQADLAGSLWEWTGSAWKARHTIGGKMWRTGGFSGAMTVGTEYRVEMEAGRVAGGFVFDNANDSLIIPVDGFYDIDLHGYTSGGSAAQVQFSARRGRTSVANAAVLGVTLAKTTAAFDAQGVDRIPRIPLKANDTLSLLCTQQSGSPVTFYGANEIFGCSLSVEYVDPLAGATPI